MVSEGGCGDAGHINWALCTHIRKGYRGTCSLCSKTQKANFHAADDRTYTRSPGHQPKLCGSNNHRLGAIIRRGKSFYIFLSIFEPLLPGQYVNAIGFALNNNVALSLEIGATSAVQVRI